MVLTYEYLAKDFKAHITLFIIIFFVSKQSAFVLLVNSYVIPSIFHPQQNYMKVCWLNAI